jgi:hypothetical protein
MQETLQHIEEVEREQHGSEPVSCFACSSLGVRRVFTQNTIFVQNSVGRQKFCVGRQKFCRTTKIVILCLRQVVLSDRLCLEVSWA